MCHDPNTLPDGTVVACRKCELCRYNRVKDWAGRNIAQSKISTASFSCNLTYGPELDQYPQGHSGEYGRPIPGRSDHIRAAVLTYSDVQKFLKYLRSALGYDFDYFVTGELGGLNHRAHWHIIFHFRGAVPPHELNVNFSDRHVNEFGKVYKHDVCKAWPHGFMFWKKAKFEDVFYDCKYILKAEEDDEAQRKPGMSKKPPIGAEYFERWADQFVADYLAPQKLEYWFPEIKKKDGKPLIFKLSGRTAEMFLERYIAHWQEVHPDVPRPRSDLVDLFEKYGKIVTDEARMLLRQEFPKGESRQAIPTGQQIKTMAEDARAELEQWRREMAALDVEQWQENWVKEAPSGQERQRREEVVQFEQWAERQQRAEDFDEFRQYKARHGWEFIVGQGWVHTGPGPGNRGDEEFRVWLQAKQSRQRAAELEPDNGRRRAEGEPEPTGPVGKWNRHYGKAAK